MASLSPEEQVGESIYHLTWQLLPRLWGSLRWSCLFHGFHLGRFWVDWHDAVSSTAAVLVMTPVTVLRVDSPCGHLCALASSGNKSAWTGECWENSQNWSSSSCFWELLLLIFLFLVDRWIKRSTVEVIRGIQSSSSLSKSASWSDYREKKPTHSLN